MNARPRHSSHATIRRARELRINMTLAERILWGALRDRRLGGAKFRRQHPEGSYFTDFVCVERKLVVELDGGQHCETKNERYDAGRTIYLNEQGLRVIRFWNLEVMTDLDGVVDAIARALSRDLC